MYKNEEEMKKAALLIMYEWRQFYWADSIVNPDSRRAVQTRPMIDKVAQDAALETFLLHARVLRDFFSNSRPRPRNADTDILAEDFFNTPGEWTKPTLKYLTETRSKERLDRALAHLSYDRISYAETGKGWRTSLIADELIAAWAEFLGTLHADRKEWFLSV
jgi:hypothetical protein